jgi:pimeloyl-ACP methyl ester carboxylesterase
VPYLDHIIESYRRRWETTGTPLEIVEQRVGWFKAQLARVAAGTLKEFRDRPGGLMADLLRFDIFSAFKKIRVPALILAGTSDVTVRQADVNALRASMPANRKVVVVQPRKVGHLLQETPRALEAMEEWKDPAPLAPEVIKALTGWLSPPKGP